MMNQKQQFQPIRISDRGATLLVFVLIAAFLITGKLFVFGKAAEPDIFPDEPYAGDETLPPVTDLTSAFGSSSSVSTTTTSAITGSSAADGSDATLPLASDTAVSVPIISDTAVSQDMDGFTTTLTTTTEAVIVSTTTTAATVSETAPPPTTTVTTTTTEAAPVIPQNAGFSAAPDGYFNDALFIGDSRTVGMRDYAPIAGADYFCNVGMSIYNVRKTAVNVAGRGSLTFSSLISGKKYGKVYIMLGVNEVAEKPQNFANFIQGMVSDIQKSNPNVIVYLEANLHFAASRSNKDKVYNNTKLNAINNAVKGLANGTNVFYLDVNPLFDDANGCMRQEMTGDGTHPYAKYYLTWRDWLMNNVVI